MSTKLQMRSRKLLDSRRQAPNWPIISKLIILGVRLPAVPPGATGSFCD